MDDRPWQTVDGVVMPGHRVASGTADDSPYPAGTIAMQTPYFQALGLDLAGYFPGTLNLSIAPSTFRWIAPAITFQGVAWTDRHPPEDFSFSPCQVRYGDRTYRGLIYYPHPDTKQRHFQSPSILEVIAEPIASVTYGDRLTLAYDGAQMAVMAPRPGRDAEPTSPSVSDR